MKRIYKKPSIVIENFLMDIDIASNNPIYNAIIATLKDIYGDAFDNDEIAEYIKNNAVAGADDGWCYASSVVPS